eukprot:CAMPEP_0117662350 /NCGR_PEP_ID=MMETSP0804-20121206/8009_1 /TAXON_ID=1074897 /ORGANISM="Tetraselmis astigmatica, Strain CCMP880" /LENGTH=166 /DNA_ID=CAMNT_0005469249 /DNA_START=244 /DNA_END=743 /DNA_ORIENTATION=+
MKLAQMSHNEMSGEWKLYWLEEQAGEQSAPRGPPPLQGHPAEVGSHLGGEEFGAGAQFLDIYRLDESHMLCASTWPMPAHTLLLVATVELLSMNSLTSETLRSSFIARAAEAPSPSPGVLVLDTSIEQLRILKLCSAEWPSRQGDLSSGGSRVSAGISAALRFLGS